MKSKILNKIIKTSIYLRKAKYFQLRVYEKQCIFCEKKEKFVKGSKSREGLTQARQLRVHDTVRKAAEIKHDKRILALASRELVADSCDCIRNGLKCSDLCRLITCSNQPDEEEDIQVDLDEEHVDFD